MSENYIPRLAVEISEEHKQKLDKHFGEHGQKKLLVSVILEDLFSLVEEFGSSKIVGAIASRNVTLKDICKMKLEK